MFDGINSRRETALEEGEVTENGNNDTQDTAKDTVSVHVQAELHTNNEESTQTDGKTLSSAVEVKHASCQASMPDDFSKFSTTLLASFADLRADMADREVRYLRKIERLTSKVEELEETLAKASSDAKQAEQRLLNKVALLNSRLSTLANTNSNPIVGPVFHTTDKPQMTRTGETPRSPKPLAKQHNSQPERKNGKPDTETEIDTPDLHQGPLPPSTQPKPHTDQGQDSCAPMMETDCDGPWRQARVKAQKNEIARPAAKVNRLSKTHLATAGQGPNTVLRGSAPVKKSVFYLGGIDAACSAEDISAYCHNKNVRVASCRILPSNRFGTVSARLSVAAADAETVDVLNADFWPNLVKIRPWKFEAVAGEGDGW